jgi:hypothetical protein
MHDLIGKMIRDNDPRNEGRTVVVKAVVDRGLPGKGWALCAVWIAKKGRRNYIRLDRIFTDGKKRARGWNLV